MLADKHRPSTYDEFVGDPKLLQQTEEFVQNDVPVILVGTPGIGKTTMAYLIAGKLGLTVLESNASDERRKDDLKNFEKQMSVNQLVPTLFLLDEIDGMEKRRQKQLADIIKKANSPIVLTANDKMKIDLSLKKNCKFVEMKLASQNLRAIVDRIKDIAKKEGIEEKDIDFKKINLDIRSSINGALEKSQGYETEKNNFEKIDAIFKESIPDTLLSHTNKDVTIPWILDNIFNYYNGIEIHRALQTLMVFGETRNINVLSCFPKSTKGIAMYPRYLRKRSKFYAKSDE